MIQRATRHERAIAVTIAVLLVTLRSLPFALYEQIQFDSDQAVFGLMAKHLSEGRAFPLFMYGNAYLLAVEAWLAAPWFLVAPINLTTLSLSLVLTNIATAVLLLIGLERWAGLRPIHALVASLFFVLAPPIVSGDLVSVSGGNVEPFLYVALLWLVVDRPFLFGTVLAIGTLQREFTMYAVPVLAASDASRRWPAIRAVIRKWLIALVVFLTIWQAVQALQRYSDLMGPGTRGQLLGGFTGSPVSNLAGRVTMEAASIPSRIGAMVQLHVPRMLGAIAYEDRIARRRPWLMWMIAAGIVAALLRVAMLAWRTARSEGLRSLQRAAFGWYLLAVGSLAAAAYVAARPISEEYSRYGLLVILAPIGMVSVLLCFESRRWIRAATVTAVIAWAAISARDTAGLYHRSAGAAPGDLRILADALVAKSVRTARAPYWTAYAVTFMTGERVKVASTDFVRITEYQAAAAADPDAIDVSEQPCERGERVARWFLCRR